MTVKIGLFGGTFDPIHQGHVHMALAFAAELALDSVILIPAGDPYHKEQPRTAAAHRLAMVEAAIAEHPQLAVSDCDMVREGATYTVDTVQIFRQLFPQAQLWWLLGMDSLLQCMLFLRLPRSLFALQSSCHGCKAAAVRRCWA